MPAGVRFWAKVDRRGFDECWPWTGGTVDSNKPGHQPRGKFWVPGEWLGLDVATSCQLAPRVAFYLVHGRWPQPQALHGCDDALCCNAENSLHVHEGTPAQNAEERMQRGRGAIGERIGLSKVSDAQAQEMYDRYQQGGIDQRALAAEFGITQPSVSYIVRGRRRSLQ